MENKADLPNKRKHQEIIKKREKKRFNRQRRVKEGWESKGGRSRTKEEEVKESRKRGDKVPRNIYFVPQYF